MILDGLQVTLLITLFATILGTLLGGLICWMRMKAVVASVLLLLMGLAGYDTGHTAATAVADTDVPPVFKALKGKRVAVIVGSIQDIAVADMAPDADILRMTSVTDLLAALDKGKVDVAGSESLTMHFCREVADKVDSIGTGLPPIPIAACFRKDNSALQQDFNSFLAEIRRDGTYQKIYDRWQRSEDPSVMPIPEQRLLS